MVSSMKRILLYTLMIAINLMTFFGTAVFGTETFCLAEETETTTEVKQLYAQSAVLMDADSGRILYEKKGSTILPMASTTKIMTCIITLENGNLENQVEVSDYAASMPKVKLYMKKGETYRLKDLLYSLMLESHNDTAVAIAEHIAGSVEGFADLMNQKAVELGCKNTYFITPNGLDAQKEITAEDGSTKTVIHSTTAEDLARIMSYCIKKSPKKEEFLEITRTPSHTFTNSDGTRSFTCNNHNAFLSMMDGALSGKTGFTGKAGYCYVGALERDGKTFVVALLACGWPNNKTYKWKDTRSLMEYGLSNYESANLAALPISKEWLNDIPVSNAQSKRLFGETSVKVYLQKGDAAPTLLMRPDEQADVICNVETWLEAPVKKGQTVGKIQYILDGLVLWERTICAAENIQKTDYVWYLKMTFLNYFS